MPDRTTTDEGFSIQIKRTNERSERRFGFRTDDRGRPRTTGTSRSVRGRDDGRRRTTTDDEARVPGRASSVPHAPSGTQPTTFRALCERSENECIRPSQSSRGFRSVRSSRSKRRDGRRWVARAKGCSRGNHVSVRFGSVEGEDFIRARFCFFFFEKSWKPRARFE